MAKRTTTKGGKASFNMKVRGGSKWLNRFAKLDGKAVRFSKGEGRRLKRV